MQKFVQIPKSSEFRVRFRASSGQLNGQAVLSSVCGKGTPGKQRINICHNGSSCHHDGLCVQKGRTVPCCVRNLVWFIWSLIPPEHVAKLSPSWASFSLSVFWPVPECAIVTAPAQLYLSDPFGFSSVSLNRPSQPVSMTWLWNSARWGHRSKITARITYHGISWRVKIV